MTRKEAIGLGLTKYSTGKPCVHGHTASRYTQSGTCEECINGSRATVNSPSLALRQQKLEIERQKAETAAERVRLAAVRAQQVEDRKAEREQVREAAKAREQLTKMKTLCPHPDIGNLRNFAFMCAAVRDPRLGFKDTSCSHITPGSPGGNVGLYTLMCFPEDRAAIVEYAKALMQPTQMSPAEIAAVREERLAAALHDADTEAASNWPKGDPR